MKVNIRNRKILDLAVRARTRLDRGRRCVILACTSQTRRSSASVQCILDETVRPAVQNEIAPTVHVDRARTAAPIWSLEYRPSRKRDSYRVPARTAALRGEHAAASSTGKRSAEVNGCSGANFARARSPISGGVKTRGRQ